MQDKQLSLFIGTWPMIPDCDSVLFPLGMMEAGCFATFKIC
jgi:hypothetical protein